MSRNVQIVLLCEDTQQETFGRRFLRKMGWSTRNLRVEKAPAGIGSAEQFVRKRFPEELRLYRHGGHHASRALLVMMDGDNRGVDGRIAELDAACGQSDVPSRRSGEHVLVFVPTWRIETWLAYLGGEAVDERKRDYPRLARQGDCQRHVDELADMCGRGKLRRPAPPSLVAACAEYRGWPNAMRESRPASKYARSRYGISVDSGANT